MAWAFHDGGYELRFNRDEKWVRDGSEDPSLETDHPITGACARDAAAGGTWLFTNEYGLTLALMNAYPDGRIPAAGSRSRGNIPFAAASAKTIDEAESALFAFGCADFAPFEAVLIAEAQVRRFGWDGETFRRLTLPPRTFLTTSSVESASVIAARNARFDALSSSSWHAILDDSFSGGNPAAAIHVTREDGGTVSQTSVIVTTADIRFSVCRRGGPLQEILFPRKS
jgi:hypothetical protein